MIKKSKIRIYLKLINTLLKKNSVNKYQSITAYATFSLAVLAAFTTYYAIKAYKIQNESIKLQRDNNQAQFDYYKKTTRPFVFVDSVKIIRQDSLVDVEITLKNVGNLPAKNIYVQFPFQPKPDFDKLQGKVIRLAEEARTYTGLYPEKTKKIYFYGSYNPVYEPQKTLNDRTKDNPYLHVLIFYYGMNGEEYFYLEIFTFDSQNFKFIENTSWVNFN